MNPLLRLLLLALLPLAGSARTAEPAGIAELSLDRRATHALIATALERASVRGAGLFTVRAGAVDRLRFVERGIEGELLVTATGGETMSLPFRAVPELERLYGRWQLRLEPLTETETGTLARGAGPIALPDVLTLGLEDLSSESVAAIAARIQRVRVTEERLVLELALSAAESERDPRPTDVAPRAR